jgi:hypothetical protein
MFMRPASVATTMPSVTAMSPRGTRRRNPNRRAEAEAPTPQKTENFPRARQARHAMATESFGA